MQRISAQPRQAHNSGSPNNNNSNETHSRCRGPLPLSRLSAPEPLSPLTEDTPLRYTRRFPSYYHSRQPVRRTVISNNTTNTNTNNMNDISNPLSPRAPSASWSRPLVLTPERGHRTSMSVTAISSPTTTTTMTTNTITNNNNVATAGMLEVRKRRSTAGHSVSSSTITPKRSGSHDDVFMDQPFSADPLSVRPTSSHGRSRSAPLMMMAPHDSALLVQQQQQQMSPPNSHLLSVPQQQSISQAISLHSNKEPQSSAAAAGAMRLTEVSLNATHPTRSHGRRVQAIDDSFLHAVEDAPPGLLRFVQQQQMQQQQQRRRSNGSRGSVSFTVSSMHTTSNSTSNNHNNTTTSTSNNMTTSKLVGSSAELHRNSQHVIHVPSSLPRSSAVTMSTPTTTTLTTTTTTTNTTTMNTGSHTRLHTNGAEENNGIPETHSNATPLITSLEPPTSVTAVMEVLPVEADEDGAQAMLLHTTRTNSQEVNSFTSPASATLVSTVSLTGTSQGRAANESHVTFGTSSLYNPSWQSLSMRLRCHNGWVGPAHTSPPHMQSPPLPSQLASQASYSGLTARRNSGSHTSRPVRLRLRGGESEQDRRMTPVTHDISLSAQLRSRSNEIEEEEEEEVDETDGSVACVRRMDPTTPNGSAKASEEREDGEGIVYCVRRSKSTLCGNKRLKKEDVDNTDDNVERGMSSRKGGKAVRLSPTQLRSRPTVQPSTLSDDDNNEKNEEEGKKQQSAQRNDITTQQQKDDGVSNELPAQRSAQNGEKVARPLLLHPTPSTSVLSSPTIEATRTGLDVPQCSITSLTSPAIQALSSVTSQPQEQQKEKEEQKETVQVHPAHLGSPPLHPAQPALSSFHAVPNNNNNTHHPIHSGRLSFTASQTEIEGAAGTHATTTTCAAIDLTTGLIQRPALGEVSGRTGLEPGHQTITTNTAASSLTWSALTQTPTVDHLVDVGWYQREHTALEASLGAGISATSMLFSCDKTPCTSQATAITTRIHCLTLPRVSSALSSCCCCCTGACGGSPLLDGVLRSSGSVMNHHNNTNNNNNNSSYNATVRTTPPIPAMMGSEGEATAAAANAHNNTSIGSATTAAATGGGGGVVMMGPTCAAHAHSHAPAAVPWRMLTPHSNNNNNMKADTTDTPQADIGESKYASPQQQQHHQQDSVGNFLRAGVPHQLELPAHPSGLPTPAVTTTTTTTTTASITPGNAENNNSIGSTTSLPRDNSKQQQNEGSQESECGRATRAQYYEAQACPSTPCELNESNVSWSNEAPLPRRSISSNHHHHNHRVSGCSAAHKHSHHHHHTHRASRCSISRSTARSGFGSPTRTPLQFLTPPTFTTDALPFTRHLSGASSLELSANAKEDAALSLYTEGSQAPCEESSGPTNSIETSSFGAVSPFGPLPIRNARQRRSTVRAGEVSPWWNAAAFATLHIAPTTSMNHNTYYNSHYTTACCSSSRERRGSRMRSEQLREANHSLTSLLTGTTCESKTLLVAPEILEVSNIGGNGGSGMPGRRSNSRVCMRPEQGTSPTTTSVSRQANGGSIYSGANPPSGMTTRRQSRSSAKWHSQLPPSSSSFAPLSLGIDDMDN